MVRLFHPRVLRHSRCEVRFFSTFLKLLLKNIISGLSLQQQIFVLQQCFSNTSLPPDTHLSLSLSGP